MQCYKSVCYDIEKASKKVHKKQRLNVLYIISDICRRSQARLGVKDKYGMLTDPPVPPARLAAKSFAKMDQGGAVMLLTDIECMRRSSRQRRCCAHGGVRRCLPQTFSQTMR